MVGGAVVIVAPDLYTTAGALQQYSAGHGRVGLARKRVVLAS